MSLWVPSPISVDCRSATDAEAAEECIMDAGKALDSDIVELLEIIMAENNLHHADNMEEAVDLYTQLRQLINYTLFDA